MIPYIWYISIPCGGSTQGQAPLPRTTSENLDVRPGFTLFSIIIDTFKLVSEIAAYVLAVFKLAEWFFGALKSWWRAHKPPATELIERRVKMREEIERNLQCSRRHIDVPATETHLATRIEVIDFEDIIIIDISRMNEFPKIDEHSVGISPWFKLDVLGFYHRGIEVFLDDSRKVIQTRDDDGLLGWRFLKKGEDSESAMYAFAIGRIPFDFIERVDWSRSDGYYDSPHVYCRFAGPLGGPYENVIYKANLYPEVSRHLHDLDLHRESYEWGWIRRRAFLVRQSIVRCWRRLKTALPIRHPRLR